MITLIACDKDSSRSHTITVNASTKTQLKKSIDEFSEEVNLMFRKWIADADTMDATPEQEQWLEELDWV